MKRAPLKRRTPLRSGKPWRNQVMAERYRQAYRNGPAAPRTTVGFLDLAVQPKRLKRVEMAATKRGRWEKVKVELRSMSPAGRATLARAVKIIARKPIPRTTRIRPRGKPSKVRARFLRQFGGRYGDWLRALPCVIGTMSAALARFKHGAPVLERDARVRACDGPIELDHEPTRGAGGTARDMNPVCRGHHRQRDAIGVQTFQAVYGVDLRAEAARSWAMGKQFASVEALAVGRTR